MPAVGAHDARIARVHAAGEGDPAPARDAAGHEAGLGQGAGAVVEAGVGDIHSGEGADQGLELEDRLQCALGDLRLVGRVAGQELPPADHLIDDGRDEPSVGAAAPEAGESAAGRLRPWVRDFPGRALALVLECGAPVDLAAAQALFALDDGFASYAAEVRLWVDYLRRRRIDRILLLLLAFERRGRRTFEVLEAFQRTLPIPLSKAPRDLVADWLGR